MSLKLKKKRNTLENGTKSNVLHLDTLSAWSYGWWKFTQLMPDGTILFNDYSYSNSTRVHQGHVYSFLMANHIKMKSVYWGAGLQAPEREIENKNYKIKSLETLINTPKTRKAKNAERAQEILEIKQEIKEIEDFIVLKNNGQLNNKFTGQLSFDCLKPKPRTQFQWKSEKELFEEEMDKLT